jgi:hypothetical protein
MLGPKQCIPRYSSIDGWGVAKSSHDDSAPHDHPSCTHVIQSINQHIITSSYSLQFLIHQVTVISHLDFSSEIQYAVLNPRFVFIAQEPV